MPSTLWQLAGYFLRLGTLGFGGPVALVEYMRRDLVDERRWVSAADYRDGLALAQLAPGPLAAQLAIYLGYAHSGVLGATLIGAAFVAPSFLMVVGLGWAYKRYDGLPWMQAAFYGVGAAVIGIIANSAYRLTTRTVGGDRLLWGVYLAAALTTIATESESLLLFLGAGLLVWAVRMRARPPAAALAVVPVMGLGEWAAGGTLLTLFGFFAYAGSFVFGSGLAIVPFLYSGVVREHAWLTEQQFVDAVAVAMITPGPVVITTGFIGYLVADLPGAVVAAAGTFLPAYFLTIGPAPYFRRHGRRPGVVAFVDGVTAAAIGAITGAVVVLGQRAVTDLATLAIAAGAASLLLWRRRLPEPLVIIGAAALGLLLRG